MLPHEPAFQPIQPVSNLDYVADTPPPLSPPSVFHRQNHDSLYSSRCLQLIWNEVERLTSLGVIRTEEDKWFFAYRKAVRILEGDE